MIRSTYTALKRLLRAPNYDLRTPTTSAYYERRTDLALARLRLESLSNIPSIEPPEIYAALARRRVRSRIEAR